MKDKECFVRAGLWGWGGRVTLIRHNLSIIPLSGHNFEHNTLVSRVTPESINRQTLILGKKIAEGRKAGRASEKPRYSPVP